MQDLRRVLSAGTLAGDPVKNPTGERIGDVKEVMIDLPTGRVAYLVLSYGGFLGMGDKLFAVPWDVVTIDQDDQAVVVDIDKSELERAPGFDNEAWPDFSDATWTKEIHEHYGVPYEWYLT
ncbi:MAG TPA: PRC-barrel domain-containing protein [Acidimicrobiia bacterium]